MQLFLIISAIGAIFCIFTTLAVVDVILKDFNSLKSKVVWGIIAMIPFLGWVIYLVFGFKKGKRKVQSKSL